MLSPSIKRDIDNAVIGKTELNCQAIAVFLSKFYNYLESVEERLNKLEKNND